MIEAVGVGVDIAVKCQLDCQY